MCPYVLVVLADKALVVRTERHAKEFGACARTRRPSRHKLKNWYYTGCRRLIDAVDSDLIAQEPENYSHRRFACRVIGLLADIYLGQRILERSHAAVLVIE